MPQLELQDERMVELAFFVPGVPKPQSRPRVTSRGTFSSASPELKEWRKAVRVHALSALGGKPGIPKGRSIEISLRFLYHRPPSHFNAKGLLKKGARSHPGRGAGDLDNLTKAVTDELEKAKVFHDDADLALVMMSKQYIEPGVERGCFIRVREL